MKKTGEIQIASRYVSALFEVAQSASALAAVEKDLRDFAAAIGGTKSLASLIASPLLNRAQHEKIVAALADSFNAHPVTKQFLIALAAGRRLALLPEIAAQFGRRAQEARGEMSAEVVAAYPLGKEEAEQVAAHLGRAYGKNIKLTVSQDKNLLGGMVVKIGGVQLDGSLAGKLERVNIALKAA